MSRLSKLIAELCPNGVEYKKLGEVAELKRGIRVVRSQLSEGGTIPVFQNSLKPLGYHTESNCLAKTAFVICAGAAGEVGFSDIPFWAADDCHYFICPENLNSRYLYYFLCTKREHLLSKVRKASIPRLAREFIENLSIPLPPLEIQSEIVKILDNFAELTAELTAELEKRKKQYEHYRDMLLNFTGGGRYDNISQNEPCPSVEWKRLGEICEVKTGKLNANAQSENGKYPFFTCSDVPLRIDEYAFDCEALLIAGNGNIGETKHYIGKFNAYQRTYVLSSFASNISVRYLYFYITAFIKPYVKARSKDGTLPYITLPILSGFEIPLPPLAEQERIVAILDRFDSLCNSLTEGLPAEIALRKKQYEYYRDRLLNFEKAS